MCRQISEEALHFFWRVVVRKADANDSIVAIRNANHFKQPLAIEVSMLAPMTLGVHSGGH